GLVPAVEAIKIPVTIDRCVEVQPELLRRPHDAMREVGADLEQRASRPIARRNEHLVVEDDRTRCVDRLVAATTPRKREVYFAGGWIDGHQAAGRRLGFAAGEHEHATLAVRGRGNG